MDDVILFERIAAFNSISAGGAACGLSATVSSDRLKRLEVDLGCTLLNRTTRSMSLTEEGTRFLDKAIALIRLYETTQHSVGKRSEVPMGLMRIAAPYLFGKKFLTNTINEFLSAYPETQLDLKYSDEVLDYTVEGIDIAIRIGRLADSSRIARKLGDSERVLCASPEYIKRTGTPKSPAELNNHNCIIFMGEDRWKFVKRSNEQSVFVSGRIKTNCAEMATIAALNGHGIALRSLWDIQDDLDDGRLVHVLPSYKIPTDMCIYAIYPPGRFVSPAARIFTEILQQNLKDTFF